ncbi:MAG: hypothetical protein IJ564_00955 [Alphaproteobacteria bacterium]|nr:hypothetical protein [Alphaproteobacteria bacterium]
MAYTKQTNAEAMNKTMGKVEPVSQEQVARNAAEYANKSRIENGEKPMTEMEKRQAAKAAWESMNRSIAD